MVSLAQNCAHARIEKELESLYNTNLNHLLEVAKSKESKQNDLDFLADLASSKHFTEAQKEKMLNIVSEGRKEMKFTETTAIDKVA